MKTFLNILFLVAVSAFIAGNTYGIEYTVPTAFGMSLVGAYIMPAFQGVALMAISTEDARGIYTKAFAKVYKEKVSATNFLTSFFPSNENMTKYISIEVRRATEKVAADVIRGTRGNRNKVTRSTEKVFLPPHYWEYFNVNELAIYDQVIGSGTDNARLFAQLVNEAADELLELQKKIERAYELQASQVLLTGIVTLVSGDNIDFKRKSASMVDYTSTPWTTGTVNPIDHLKTGCDFIRQQGKAQGQYFNCIMGADAYEAFVGNTIIKARADIRNFSFDNLMTGQKTSQGGVPHGVVDVGSYKVRIWTYPEFYDLNGTSTPYIDDNAVVLLPDNPNFSLEFAAVPQLLDSNGSAPQKGAYLIDEYIDERAANHEQHIKSAGVCIPTAIDQVWTADVVPAS